jgi:hypothetical protein
MKVFTKEKQNSLIKISMHKWKLTIKTKHINKENKNKD